MGVIEIHLASESQLGNGDARGEALDKMEQKVPNPQVGMVAS